MARAKDLPIALLQHQLRLLQRQRPPPRLTRWEKPTLAVLATELARLTAGPRSTLERQVLLCKPDTILKWHRELVRRKWTCRRTGEGGRPTLAAEVEQLLLRLARENPCWGYGRLQGELLKLGIRVSKRTVRKYMRRVPRSRPSGQEWTTFLRNHVGDIWACDFLQVTDVFFRPLFAFFLIDQGSRRAVHVGVTRHPTDAWVAQQLREATPYGEQPRFLVRDNDAKCGPRFAQLAQASGIAVVRTPVRAPRANAVAERFLGSVRRECLDHLLVLGERHLGRVVREYVAYFNQQRPHQGLGRRVPTAGRSPGPARLDAGDIVAVPVLGGLHHAYRRAA